MGRPRVLVARPDIPESSLAPLRPVADLVVAVSDYPDQAELCALAAGVDGHGVDGVLCMGHDRVDGTFLAAAGRDVRIVSLASAGFDEVDVEAARRRGVVVSHAPGVLAETTADTAFGLLLMARRRLPQAADDMRRGRWEGFRASDHLGLDVSGALLGIIGFGDIGRALARRAVGFGMRVQHVRRPNAPSDVLSEAVDLDTLLRTSDVVSLNVPLTDSTRRMIDADALALMKPTATLLNTGRGGLLDEAALLHALREGRLHSAGLDVFEGEPRNDVTDPIFHEDRLVVLPHIGSATESTRGALSSLAARNVAAVLSGARALTPLPGSPAVYDGTGQ